MVWLRLLMLMPLLPVIYLHREADPAKNLRYGLAHCLIRLAAHPLISAPSASGLVPDSDAVAAAAAAAAEAGEPLFARLLSVLLGVVGNSWASWLRGDKVRTCVTPLLSAEEDEGGRMKRGYGNGGEEESSEKASKGGRFEGKKVGR